MQCDLDMVEAKVRALREQIRGYRQRRTKLTESDTIRVLIQPLLQALGWDHGDVDEVRSEYRHKASDNPVDMALFLHRAPVLFVEAKALSENMADRRWLVQTLNYANTSNVDWCVLTNGDEWRLYKVHAQVEAEDKLFLSLQIDSDDAPSALARKLALISRADMGQRAIDALWNDWHVDHQVQTVLEQIPDDDRFLRLLGKMLPNLGMADIRGSLRRAAIRVDYPDLSEVIAGTPVANSEPLSTTPVMTPDPEVPEAPTRVKRRLPGTQDMLEKGLLKLGQVLTIRGRPDSQATVLDGRKVRFRGEDMTFNDWGCRVTGWTAIQIYVHAADEEGRLLDDLRQEMIG